MKVIYKIAKSELSMLFYSPVAWLILVIFTFQTSMAFSGLFSDLVVDQAIGNRLWDVTERIYTNYRGLLSQVQQYLYLYIPLLTMGLMSKERNSGSIKLLFSSPITNTQIIIGKYFAMMIYALVLIAIILVYIIFGIFVDLCLCCYRFVHVKFDILSSCCGNVYLGGIGLIKFCRTDWTGYSFFEGYYLLVIYSGTF